MENLIKTNKKLSGYYGIDFVGSLLRDKVEVESINSTIVINKIEKLTSGFGLSPFIGVRYFLGKRVYLSSEAKDGGIVKPVAAYFSGYCC